MRPTEKQLDFAKDIAIALNLDLPKGVSKDKLVCGQFIGTHKENFYKSIGSAKKTRANFYKKNSEAFHSSSRKKGGTYDDATSTINEREVIRYWHEGLLRSAFEGFGNLESELTGVHSFSFDKIEYVLHNFPCKNLEYISQRNENAEEDGKEVVRHLLMILESSDGIQVTSTKSIVLLVFPLSVHFDLDEHDISQKIPYVWRRARRELPIFNHRLLGVEAEIDGLMLGNSEALDKILFSADTHLSDNATLQQCIVLLDHCFNALTDKNHGCSGWVDEFTSNKRNYALLRNKQVRFKLVNGNTVSGATQNIRLCYEEIMNSEHCFKSQSLKLLRRVLGNVQTMPQGFTSPQEKQNWEELGSYLGHMDSHGSNKKRDCYSLDSSQRIALTVFKKVKEGNVLAVNGPPGTGKTSLLRAVIADEWIRPLVSDEAFPDCPIIIACAATNQAVTNIISSFDSVPGPVLFNEKGELNKVSPSLESRWLPHLISYGWYQPASIGKKIEEYDGFQVIFRKSPSQPWQFDFGAKNFQSIVGNLFYLENCYLAVATKFFGQEETLLSIMEKLRKEIKSIVTNIAMVSSTLKDWRLNVTGLMDADKHIKKEKSSYALLKKNFELKDPMHELLILDNKSLEAQSQLSHLVKLRREIEKELSPSFYRQVMRRVKRYFWKEKKTYKHEVLENALMKLGSNLPKNSDSFLCLINSVDKIITEVQDKFRDLQSEKINLEHEIKKTLEKLKKFEKCQQDYLILSNNISSISKSVISKISLLAIEDSSEISLQIARIYHMTLKSQNFCFETAYASLLEAIQNSLDISIRPKLFHLAARYWEARYLHYRKSLKDAPAPSINRLRELAMLAPVFVTTSYSAPKLMRCTDESRAFNYLYGYAELLIIDEAGQGTSEIGACTLAFSKRAIVVGDTQQLSPVWSITPIVDNLIHKKLNMQQSLCELKEKGFLLSSGSLMLMAQYASAFYLYEEYRKVPGVMLTNHYRCRSPIIRICNEMVYGGALTVVEAATEPKKVWRLPLGFIAVPGDSTRLPGGSKCNVLEAEWIARWLKENESSILAHYASENRPKDLANFVAILTPFKGQVIYLRKAIAKMFGDTLDDKDALANRMVIGTVHSLQGSEREIIIFSMVDTIDPSDNTHFYDTDSTLINVAVSRAKEVFILALDQKAINYGRDLIQEKLTKPSDYLFYHIVHNGMRLNSRRLLLIESPNKHSHLETALSQGMELEIIATNGHLTQFDPSSDWDPLSSDEPKWLPLSDKEALIYERTALLWPDLEAIYIATDPDAEGECIAWQFINRVQSFLPSINQSSNVPVIKRMRFYNLVSEDIQIAYEQASTGLDPGLVKSALFRAILDQIIGRHYPMKLGLGTMNSFYAGVGRVQLSILDIAQQLTVKKEQYYIEASLPVIELNTFGSFILYHSDNATPILFTDPLQVEKAAEKLNVILANYNGIKFNWHAVIEQLPEYPAINTATFLALACRSYDLTPWQVMDILQVLYEGQKSICNETMIEMQI